MRIGNIQQLGPISLVNDYVMPKIHLEEAVDALGLSIGLRVDACRELQIGSQHLEEFRPKLVGESWVSIAHDALQNSL